MNVLVVGSGGREHVLLHKIKQSPLTEKLYIAPGNAGMRKIAKTVDIAVDDVNGLVQFAKDNSIDLVVVGPELPLCLGIADEMKKVGINVFGPSMQAAKLEGSKIYAKEFMEKYDIPTAKYRSFSDSKEAIASLNEFSLPVVIKADGLAAGKGVVIANSNEEAVNAIRAMIDDKKFGDSGSNLIVEEYLDGVEASQLCFVDGDIIIPLDSVQDYKREKDGDAGENTGGMGTYSPSRFMNEETKKYIFDEILMPFVRGINLLYLMKMTTENRLSEVHVSWSDEAAVCVVLASEGYPRKTITGRKITGLDKVKGATVFHAATKLVDGEYYSTGGRVLSVVVKAPTIEEARERVYEEIAKIELEGSHYRKDIAKV